MDHGHSVVIASIHHTLVIGGARGGCHIIHPAQVSTVNVVTEGKEGIGAECHTLQLRDPITALLLRMDTPISQQ